MKKIHDTLTILLKYIDGADTMGSMCAEHDVVYFDPYITYEMVSAEDRADLEALDAFWDTGLSCWGSFV